MSKLQKRPLIISPFSTSEKDLSASERKVQIIRLSACRAPSTEIVLQEDGQMTTASDVSSDPANANNNDSFATHGESGCRSESSFCRRRFVKNWLSAFSFIEYDSVKDVMFCKVCSKFAGRQQKAIPFVMGTRNFRLSSIQYHGQSALHAKCERRAYGEQSDATDIGFEDHDKEKLIHILKSVYFIIKTKSPYTYFPHLCETQKKQGVDVGAAYTSHNKVVPCFAKYIALSIEQELSENLSEMGLFSLILDSSLARSAESHELVYIKYLGREEMQTCFLGVIDSKAKSYQSIYKNLSNIFLKFGISNWIENVVYITIDTLTNFRLWHGGLISFIKENNPRNFVCGLSCVPHKIKHCCNVFQNHASSNRFSSLLRDIFCYYDRLSEENKTLQHVNKELCAVMDNFGRLPKNTFVTFHYDTLKAISEDWISLVHLLECEQYSVTSDIKEKKFGSRILSSITRSSFVCKLALFIDIFVCLKDFSEILRKEDTLPYTVYEELLHVCADIEKAANGKGSAVQKLTEDMCIMSSTFRNIGIKVDASLNQVIDEMRDVGEALTFYLRSAVGDRSILENSIILNTSLWSPDNNLEGYGDVEFTNLYLRLCDGEGNLETALSEWHSLKSQVHLRYSSELRMQPMNATIKAVYDFNTTLPIATNLLRKLLLLDFASGEVEKGYYQMSLLKSSERSTLSIQSLQSSMMIAMYGPPLAKFDPKPALNLWLSQCNRRYRKRTGNRKRNAKHTSNCDDPFNVPFINPDELDVV